ncbi:MAG: class I SAM-dependent methyltransferase [Bacteroidia bacterium]
MTTDAHRPNLYELLRGELKTYDALIDVGCKGLYDLVDFESSPFKKLVGIDKKFGTNAFGDYLRCKTRNKKLTPEEKRLYTIEVFKTFKERFEIYEIDFLIFDFKPDTYNLIICNKVLHFFQDEIKLTIIHNFFKSLQNGGLIYLKINHNHHPDNTDLVKVDKLSDNVYRSKRDLHIRYLVIADDFKTQLSKNYRLLTKYSKVDEKTLTIVIKK